PYPAAFEDAIEAYRYLLAQGYAGDEIIVAGDSAGGGLALALTLYLRDEMMPLPAAVITMSAWTDLTLSGDSYTENFNTDPMFGGSKDTLVYHNAYPGEHDPREPYISPVFGDYTGFPPMLMQVGEREMLLSDTLEVARKAKICGVHVKEQIFPGMFHVFQMGLTRYPEAEQAWKQVRKFIREIYCG
ncbi:MAG: alpha/beta hydrolase, partial [Lachnospiraceae bacterium]|nr:alpha/beta hydrolase [Lachnospiraceae bacterium]